MDRPIFKTTAIALLIFSTFSGMVIVPGIMQSTGLVEEAPNFFVRFVMADDTTPGDGDCGIVNIYVINASLSGGAVDTRNVTDSDEDVECYLASGYSNGVTLSGNVPYNAAFIILVEAQYNYTVAYNKTASDWDVDYVSGTLTSDDLADETTEEGSDFFQTDSCARINYWIDGPSGDGTGWEVAHGETVTVTVTLYGYY